MTHQDCDGREIKVGDKVRIALPNKYCTDWGVMEVETLTGDYTVITKKQGRHQVPCYMARHLKKQDSDNPDLSIEPSAKPKQYAKNLWREDDGSRSS